MMRTAVLLLCAALLSACGPTTQSLNDQVQLAVRQTLAAMPTATPAPSPRPVPTASAVSLAGLFCEYQFCIAHPKDLAFYDVKAQQNPGSTTVSRYDDGMLAAYSASLFIEVLWQGAAAGSDLTSMINQTVQSAGDIETGSPQQLLIGKLNVDYVQITPTSGAASMLPFGGAAAWICGDRVFAWKAYTGQPDLAKDLLTQALQAFRCGS